MKGANKVVWLNRGWLPVYIGLCPSKKAWKRQMKRFKSDLPYPESAGNTSTFHNAEGQMCVIVTISERFKAGEQCHLGVVGLIIHEAAHVWQMIREDIGEHAPSPEFEAYSMQCISQELIGAFCDVRFDLFRKQPSKG